MDKLTVRGLLGAEGMIAQKLEGYEPREPQIVLAERIAKAMSECVHIAAEGPTGTGKTHAYLSAAVIAIRELDEHGGAQVQDTDNDEVDQDFRGKARCVVATANIALQQQLYKKDLPFLASVLPGGLTYAMVKGRNNYFCHSRHAQWLEDNQQGAFAQISRTSDLERQIAAWGERTETGDKEELDFAVTDEVWTKFSVTAEDCIGKECPHRVRCFAQRAKQALQPCDVIVVNYHLLFASIIARMNTGKDIVLPPFQFLVLDEAHNAADIARQFFGWSVSTWQINRLRVSLFRLHEKIAEFNPGLSRNMKRISEDMEAQRAILWDHMEHFARNAKGAIRITRPGSLPTGDLAAVLAQASECFKLAAEDVKDTEKRKRTQKDGEKAERLAASLVELFELGDKNAVYFLERAGQQKVLRIEKRMLEVGDMLWDQMFARTRSTCLTSATMAIDGDCKYIRTETGMKEGIEVIVDSPFDYKRQGLLIVSENAPDPTLTDYQEKMLPALSHIIQEAHGRTLCLFTSYKNLNAAKERLSSEALPYPLLAQGEAPRMKLVERFKSEVNSVLLGTDSFWTGVDVPGEALSCLVIDKLPFPTPGDPVLDALGERATQSGQSAFWTVSVPRAILKFRQGVGRLIRRRSDIGVVIVLDRRVVTKGYGEMFLNSLPRFKVSRSLRGSIISGWLAR